MEQMNTEVQAPVMKSVTALGAGAGTTATTYTQQAQSFLPQDLAGWLAVGASLVALCYTLTLWLEWWWKKFWKPLLVSKGWIKAPPGKKYLVVPQDYDASTFTPE